MTADPLQFSANVLMIVDFTIKGNPDAFILVAHRLSRGFRKVDNGESAVTKPNSPISRHPCSGAIRSTVDHRIAHRSYIRLANSENAIFECNCADNPTHFFSPVAEIFSADLRPSALT
jgi:hypothetical protein